MKKLLLLLLLFTYPFAVYPQTDWEPGNRMNQAIASLLLGYEAIKLTEEGRYLANYGFNSINGSYLKMGEKSFIRTTLSANSTYILMAGGDKSTFDVDIIIKDSKKKVLKRDIKSDKYAFLTFTPDTEDEYIIELSASGVTGKGFSVIAILEEGVKSNTDDIVTAIKNMEKRWNLIAGKFEVRFASDPETDGTDSYRSFCWNGFYVDKNSTQGFNENGCSINKNYLMMATGDDNATDIYLNVKYDGKDVWDKEHENYPFIIFTPKVKKLYDFSTYNHSTYGRAFIVACMFEVQE